MTDNLIEVKIPSRFVDLCSGWAGGMDCMLRAIDSTGDLTLGTNRPYNDDEDRPMTDQEWHHSLFEGLSCDIAHCRRMAERSGDEDAEALKDFEEWADSQAQALCEAYGLEQ